MELQQIMARVRVSANIRLHNMDTIIQRDVLRNDQNII